MKKDKKIKISKEQRDEMVSAIRNYFSTERGEELGDLAAGLILDFITEEIAPEFYNQGVYDSYTYLKDMAEDVLSLRK